MSTVSIWSLLGSLLSGVLVTVAISWLASWGGKLSKKSVVILTIIAALIFMFTHPDGRPAGITFARVLGAATLGAWMAYVAFVADARDVSSGSRRLFNIIMTPVVMIPTDLALSVVTDAVFASPDFSDRLPSDDAFLVLLGISAVVSGLIVVAIGRARRRVLIAKAETASRPLAAQS
ncbi:MAG: hypothetical protein MRY74_16505 [Neomegalonema sp.]|nr:hypothetical protein [Neomegalonema sp.]